MNTFTIRKFFAVLLFVVLFADVRAQVPDVYKGKTFVEYVGLIVVPDKIDLKESWTLNLETDVAGRRQFWSTSDFKVAQGEDYGPYMCNYSEFIHDGDYQPPTYANITYLWVEEKNDPSNGSPNFFPISFSSDWDKFICWKEGWLGYEGPNLPTGDYCFSHVAIPLLKINQNNINQYYACESKSLELPIIPVNKSCTITGTEAEVVRYVPVIVEASLVSDTNWKEIKSVSQSRTICNISFGDLNPGWLGKEIKFRIKQDFENMYTGYETTVSDLNPSAYMKPPLKNYYSDPITGFYFLEEPDLTITSTPPTCYSSKDASITISNIPGHTGKSHIRIDLIKYLEKPSTDSNLGAVSTRTFDGKTFYWYDQVTQHKDVASGQTTLTIKASDITDSRFKLGSGYYGIKASYPDKTSSGLCYNEKIIKIKEKAPFSLNLTIPEYSSTGGSEKYQIPRNGEKVTIGGSVSGNQGTSTLYYIKDNNTSTSFSLNSTKFGAGNYTFWAKDKEGCKSNEIKKSLSQPQAINVTSSSINPQCNKANSTNEGNLQGNISFSVSSGAIPDFYAECLNNSTGKSNSINNFGRVETKSFGNLSPGTYTLKLWDNGDPGRSGDPLYIKKFSITGPPEMKLTAVPDRVSCNGNSDGAIELNITNGFPSFSYSLNGGSYQKISGDKSQYTINNRSPGDYTVTVTDKNGCSVTKSDITVSAPAPLQITKTGSTAATCRLPDGSLTLGVTGGWGDKGYKVRLSSSGLTGAREKTISGNSAERTVVFKDLPSGTDYRAEVTNGSTCSATTANITVPEKNPLNGLGLSQSKEESCANHNDAAISVSGWGEIEDSYTCTVDEEPHTIGSDGNITGLTKTPGARVKIVEGTARGCIFEGTVEIRMMDHPVTIDKDNSYTTNASCSTATNGTITVRGEAGRGSYQYKSGDGSYSSTSTFSNQKAGTCTIYVKDAAGCVATGAFTVHPDPEPISAEKIITSSASCGTSKDGSIELKGIRHTEGLDVTVLCNNQSLGTFSPGSDFTDPDLGPGSYTFILKDRDNCSVRETVVLGHKGYQPRFTATIKEKVACSGKKNGRVLLDAGGTSGDFTYRLYADPDLGGAPVGDGTAAGTSSFEIGGLGENPGYGIEIIDSKGCGDSLVFAMPEIEHPLELYQSPVPASCEAVSNGELLLGAGGGFPFENGKYLYGYEKTPAGKAGTTEGSKKTDTWSIEGLSSGDNFTVTVEDKYGCVVSGTPLTIRVKDNYTRILGIDGTDPACRGESTGSLDIAMQWTPAAATYAYTLYMLDGSFNYTDSVKGMLEEDHTGLTGLYGGRYDLKVEDSDGCSDLYRGVVLTDPAPVTVEVEHNYIRVKGEHSGELSLAISGGNQKYEVGWSRLPGGDAFSEPDTITAPEFRVSGLPAGTYMVAVRDTARCPYFDGRDWYSKEITIEEPEKALGIKKDTVVNVSCNKLIDGQIEMQAEGGWGPYLYALDGEISQATGLFSGLRAGQYSVEVTDTAGVSFSVFYEVTEPDTLDLFIEEVHDATCPLYANGQVKASTLNGTDEGNGLHYYIEDINDRSIVLGDLYEGRAYRFTSLSKGEYELYVTDAHQCLASKTFSVGEPDTATISYRYNYIKSKGSLTGEITSEISGGNGVFDYRWYYNDGAIPLEEGQSRGQLALGSLSAGSYTLMVRDTARCLYEGDEWMERRVEIREPGKALGFKVGENRAVSCHGHEDGLLKIDASGGWGDYRFRIDDRSYAAGGTFANLPAGEYTISVKDSSGIEYSAPVTVTEPEQLKASVSGVEDVKCFGGSDGSVSLTISGGNLSYLVSGDGRDWQPGTMIDHLPPGRYLPHVKDTLGCSLILGEVSVIQPPNITLLGADITKSRCSNNEGIIIPSIEGGTGDFGYTWYKDTVTEGGTTGEILMEGETEAYVERLYSGRYQVVVTDAHDCEMPFEFFVGDITDLSVDTIITRDVWCWGYTDGEAQATVSKGNPPYSYTWSREVGSPGGASAGAIPAGEHQLLVSDTKGCKVNKEFTIGTPDSLGYRTLLQEEPLCLGGRKGRIEVAGTGGTPGYTYLWNDGTISGSLNNLDPGTYDLTMTDSHNCISKFTFSMDYERILRPDIGPDTTICHYDVLSLDGGDYHRFRWSTGAASLSSSRKVSVKTAGTYYLAVEDADHCRGFDTLSLSVSTLEIKDLRVTGVTCANASDGQAGIDINASEEDYTIVWPDGPGGNLWSGQSGGDYNVRVENPLGCKDERSFKIAEPAPLSLTASVTDPLCYGVFDGSLSVRASGGNGGYRYEWMDGAASSGLKGLEEGTYTLEVSDAKNCSITDVYALKYRRSLEPDLGPDLTICSEAVGYLSPGRFDGYRWFLEDRELGTDSVLMVRDAGSYMVEVTDADQCLAYDTVQVSERRSGLTPEFLMSTSVPMGDTLMIVDVTTPKPSALEWDFTGDYEEVARGEYFCEVIFRDEGLHQVILSAFEDACEGQARKEILVTPEVPETESRDQTGAYPSVFSSMKVSPNPTDGNFLVEVELQEAATVNLYLVRLETGQIFEKDRLTGLGSYTKGYNVSSPGQYVVFAESQGERLMQKVIVY